MNYSNSFKKSIDNIIIIYISIKKQLLTLPKGDLKIYHHRTAVKDYAVFVYYPPNGGRIYIKKNKQLLKDLALKLFLEKELQYLGELLSALQNGIVNAEKAAFSSILTELPVEILPYLSSDLELISLSSAGAISKEQLESWENLPSNANMFESIEKKHRTSDGSYVRSKSELIIYEKLLQYKINFKYETALPIGNNTYYPDFTILHPDGHIIYWEHAGMMQIDEYRRRHKRKMDIYESVGIFPWKNLIVTYDDEDGNLDIKIVESEIKNKLLI